jgi:hypothetical protein
MKDERLKKKIALITTRREGENLHVRGTHILNSLRKVSAGRWTMLY